MAANAFCNYLISLWQLLEIWPKTKLSRKCIDWNKQNKYHPKFQEKQWRFNNPKWRKMEKYDSLPLEDSFDKCQVNLWGSQEKGKWS